MENYKTEQVYNDIAKAIVMKTNVNIFENRRTLEHFDARSMMCYILRVHYKVRLTDIAKFFIAQGKKFDHSLVIYNVNKFRDEVIHRRTDLAEMIPELLKNKKPVEITEMINKLPKNQYLGVYNYLERITKDI